MSLKNFMIESSNILFDDSKNDLRALPKTVRLQILLVLSFIWSVVFSLYIFTYTTFIFGWAGVFLAHLGLIFAVYHTFKQFHKAEEKSASVFETKNFNPFKIMAIVFVIVFIFVQEPVKSFEPKKLTFGVPVSQILSNLNLDNAQRGALAVVSKA